MMCCGAPLSSCLRSRLLALTISPSWCVRSSSDLCDSGWGGGGGQVKSVERMQFSKLLHHSTASRAHDGSLGGRPPTDTPLPPTPHLELESICTEGRTGGGGTGSTVSTMKSGREKRGSKPSARQSSSLMRRRISSAFSGVISCGAVGGGGGARLGW